MEEHNLREEALIVIAIGVKIVGGKNIQKSSLLESEMTIETLSHKVGEKKGNALDANNTTGSLCPATIKRCRVYGGLKDQVYGGFKDQVCGKFYTF